MNPPDLVPDVLDFWRGDWDQVDAYATSLENYFHVEPMPWADFTVARGRALAQCGRGDRTVTLPLLENLRDKAKRLRMMAELPRLEAAVELARAN